MTFNATGGTGLLSYTVNGLPQTSPFATAAGTYTIVATDVNGCTTSVSYTHLDVYKRQIFTDCYQNNVYAEKRFKE